MTSQKRPKVLPMILEGPKLNNGSLRKGKLHNNSILKFSKKISFLKQLS